MTTMLVRYVDPMTGERVSRTEEYTREMVPLADLIAAKDAVIETEFAARHSAHIAFEVGGITYDWHADAEAINNISGVVLMIAAGVPVPNPRPWTPVGAFDPVDITHAELIGLGAAIATRKDALFVIKKAKQAVIAAMTDPAEIAAYDATAAWEL